MILTTFYNIIMELSYKVCVLFMKMFSVRHYGQKWLKLPWHCRMQQQQWPFQKFPYAKYTKQYFGTLGVHILICISINSAILYTIHKC
jgi:hypothetical protein